MGFMAYEPTRVRMLRTAMVAALDELRSIQSEDGGGADAIRVLRAAQGMLIDTWLPVLDGIVDCVAMTAYSGVRLDVQDLRQALPLMMATRFGWQVLADPLDDDPTRVTIAGARTLAMRLNTGDLHALTDTPDELRWLAVQLAAISADAVLTSTFTAEFQQWAGLCDELGGRRVELLHHNASSPSDDTAQAVALLDEAFLQLGAVWTEHHRQRSPSGRVDGPIAGLVPGASAMQPYSVAAFARYIDLDPEQRARLTDEVLTRWTWGDTTDEFSEFGWWDRTREGPNTADLLFDALLQDPEACARYVALAVDDPLTMFATADDEGLTHRVVLAGTDPRHTTGDAAGSVILPLLRFFERGGYNGVAAVFDAHDPDWQPFLGQLVAPWLLQFSPVNDDWAAEPEERRELLAFVLHDASAFDRLLESEGAALDGLAASLQQRGREDTTLEETAAFIGMLGQLDLNELVADEQRRLVAWNLWWDLAALPIGWLPPAPGAATGVSIDALHRWTHEHGWFGAPSPTRVEDRAAQQQQWMLTVAGATMAQLAFTRMIERGALPATAPPPPEPDPRSQHPQLQYERDYLAWKALVFAGPDDPLAAEIDSWKSPFLSAAHAGEELAQ